MMVRVLLPMFTVVFVSLVLLGCGSQVSISPTTSFGEKKSKGVILLTSKPVSVSSLATFSGVGMLGM